MTEAAVNPCINKLTHPFLHPTSGQGGECGVKDPNSTVRSFPVTPQSYLRALWALGIRERHSPGDIHGRGWGHEVEETHTCMQIQGVRCREVALGTEGWFC